MSESTSPLTTSSPPAVVKKSWINFGEINKTLYTSYLSAFSLSSSLVMQPFSVLVTRQQANLVPTANGQSLGVVRNLINVYKSVGFTGMYRGWLPLSYTGIPSQLLYFTITESTRELFQFHLKEALPNSSPATIDGLQSIGSSLIANAISLLAYVPGEVVSTRMMVQPREGLKMTAMTKLIVEKEGFRMGLYRGYTTSLFYNSIYSTTWWFCYSVSRREMTQIDVFAQNPLVIDGVTGLIAGVASTIITHPIDTIKTIIMTNTSTSGNGTSVVGVFNEVVKREGMKGVFKGLRGAVYSAGINSGGFAVVYELIKRSSLAMEKEE